MYLLQITQLETQCMRRTPARPLLTLNFRHRFSRILSSVVCNRTVVTFSFPVTSLDSELAFPGKHFINVPGNSRIHIQFLSYLLLIILINEKNRIIEFTQRFNIIIRRLVDIDIATSIASGNRTETDSVLNLCGRSCRRTGSHRCSVTIISREVELQCAANLMVQLKVCIKSFKRRVQQNGIFIQISKTGCKLCFIRTPTNTNIV